MPERKQVLLDSLLDEWHELDARVRDYLDSRWRDRPKWRDASQPPCRQLLIRHREARHAVFQLGAHGEGPSEDALQHAEVALRTLFHALWYVEHRERETLLEASGVHPLKPPITLVARSHAARHSG